MSMQRSSEGFNDEDRRILRLFKIATSECRMALHLVFTWGCKKAPTEFLHHYLCSKGMSNKDYKKWFDTTMREIIARDPSGNTYDISLLFACIKWGCDNVAGPNAPEWHEGDDTKLESLCTTVKNYRNRLIHGEQFPDDAKMKTWRTKITDILEKLLSLAGTRYKRLDIEVQGAISTMKDQIEKIINTQMEVLEAKKLQEELEEFREEQKKAISEQGREELSSQYRDMSKVDPASFITGRERLQVKNVFTALEVVKDNKDCPCDYQELLELKTEEGVLPPVIVVEGEAGAGKSTLAKLILADWADTKAIFQGLHRYDLVLYSEGRDRNICTFSELIQVVMPKASYKFADDDVIRSVLNLNVLLIIDGLDELNQESEKLLSELFKKQIKKSSGNLRLLITTRPSKVSDLPTLVHPHPMVHTRLKGISHDKRIEFVSKLHEEMIKEDQSERDTEKLIDLVKKSQSGLGEHYRLPLNLTLLTYLWASDPDKVNPETTATGLYIACLQLIKSRLRVRLQERFGVTRMPSEKCEEVIGEFLQELCDACLQTLSSGFMQLSEESTKKLRKKCKELEMPFHDMSEAFLAVEKEWTSNGYKTYLILPHKSIMEFYAANHFVNYINNMNAKEPDLNEIPHLFEGFSKEAKAEIFDLIKSKKLNQPKSLHEMNKVLLPADAKMASYENMFLHLSGLLAHHSAESLRQFSTDLVEILKGSGFKGTRWLDLLVETNCDDTMASLLVPHTSLQLEVRDGHTGAALALFSHLECSVPVLITLENEVSYIPNLDEMLDKLSERECAVELHLKHQWKHQQYGSSDSLLQRLVTEGNRCRVSRFTGHLDSLSNLPRTLEKLRITFVNNEHALRLLKELQELVQTNYIDYLGVHVMSDVKPGGLSALPLVTKKECGTLWLSDVADDWEEKCEVIRALLPPGGMYKSLMFPRSNLSQTQCEKIINKLNDLKVKVVSKGGLRVSSSKVTKKQLESLKTLADSVLHCRFYCGSEESTFW